VNGSETSGRSVSDYIRLLESVLFTQCLTKTLPSTRCDRACPEDDFDDTPKKQ